MKFLDLFAGIGGFRLGMESAGHECIGFCEIDKFARASYKAIHNTKGEIELHDITAVSDESIRRIGRVDIICGGFPCQAFSIAGNRRGFEDTRGTLFFEIARFASILRPKYLFLENVKGLLNHDGGATFETILGALDELGYNVEWQVLNSKDFGVPQNRERVLIVGHLRGECTRRVFPLSKSGQQVASIKEQYSNTITTRYGNSQGAGAYIVESKSQKVRSIGNIHPSGNGILIAGKLPVDHDRNSRVYDTNGLAPTLSTMQGGGQEPKIIQRGHGYNQGGEHDIAPTLTSNSYHENNVLKITEATSQGYAEAQIGDSVNLSHPNSKTRRGRVGKKIANTLLTGESQGVVEPDFRIRKLTPRECWRLQGFPDWAFEKAQEVNSNSQLYKQAGNSVTVNVIAAIAKELK
ncbi:DNA cytosine methyltransferase [Streptococcus oralis]|uniref:DNA cytosine methyltransferase n=1 Tax=Streptococcus oralis TaxID=1303 RepID=UPI0019CFBB2C|nr:DNA cytosine methyltransferase [Streptococcus oralis]MBN6014127.1 DNA cytosine methyltransferase [Streptococcus oralis subsp. oralis]